jgi:rare lipoprotein A
MVSYKSLCYLVVLFSIILILFCTGSPRYTRATHSETSTPSKSGYSPKKQSTQSKKPITTSTATKTAHVSQQKKQTPAPVHPKKEVEIQTAFAPEMRIPSGPSITTPADELKEEIESADYSFFQKGKASYYSDKLQGRKTASGERYNKKALTAAHPRLPFNTFVRVTNTRTKQSVIVRINDRGPFTKGRVIDVSRAAAEQIGMITSGIVDVVVEIQNKGN